MFTATNGFIIIAIAIVGALIGLAIALVLWYLAGLIAREIREFVDVYKGERRKCKDEDDILFSQWVEQFNQEPLNTMREYADAH